MQRFGGALNLNVHLHALVLDGIFVHDGRGTLTFHRVPRVTRDDIIAVLATIERRVTRLLVRRGLIRDGAEDAAPHVSSA